MAEPLDVIRETVHSHACAALYAEVAFSSDAAEKHIDYPDLDMEAADADEQTERWQARAREELERVWT